LSSGWGKTHRIRLRYGWAGFVYEDKLTPVQAGDVVHQRPGIAHYVQGCSEDMEYPGIVSLPADFKTFDVEPAVDDVPPPTPWR
jgi:hypothetical protein